MKLLMAHVLSLQTAPLGFGDILLNHLRITTCHILQLRSVELRSRIMADSPAAAIAIAANQLSAGINEATLFFLLHPPSHALPGSRHDFICSGLHRNVQCWWKAQRTLQQQH